MYPRLIIGVDPGPIPGVAGMWVGYTSTEVDVRTWKRIEFGFAQCDTLTLIDVLDEWTNAFPSDQTLIATETYVIGNRSGKSSHSEAREATQYILERVKDYADQHNCARVTRPASVAKAFATNERLDAAYLLKPTTGCTHARDASRHMLYAAVHDAGFPDPFSKKNER